MKRIWRRFKPSSRRAGVSEAPKMVRSGDVYSEAWEIIARQQLPSRRWWRKHRYADTLRPIAATLRARAERHSDASYYLAALIIQTPSAVAAQRSMDKHPHGYRDRQARLYELIDYNDTFVATVLALPQEYLAGFVTTCKQQSDQFCRNIGAACFSNEQWEAITHGLSREIAVYRGAMALGYEATMTSRHDDAMGIDMVVRHPESGRQVGIDVKTRSSFHFRLKDLVREGRISEHDQEVAERVGYLAMINGRGRDQVATTLLRIDEETFGRTQQFTLERLEALDVCLQHLLHRHDGIVEA